MSEQKERVEIGGTILQAGADGYVEFDGEVVCSKGEIPAVPW